MTNVWTVHYQILMRVSFKHKKRQSKREQEGRQVEEEEGKLCIQGKEGKMFIIQYQPPPTYVLAV